jgi:adenylate cyclase class 2
MEVEMKVPLEAGRLSEIEKQLDRLGVSLAEPEIQRDVYFRGKGADSQSKGPGSDLIRVRHEKGEAVLTIKRQTDRAGIWEELETAIGNGAIAERIVVGSGAEHAITVEKSRRKGNFGRIEVLVDDVRGLGLYLEVAIQTDEQTLEAQEELFELLDKLGVDRAKVELRGYPQIILEPSNDQ